jgi:hypothetical protein
LQHNHITTAARHQAAPVVRPRSSPTISAALDLVDVADGPARVAGHRPDLPLICLIGVGTPWNLALGSVCPVDLDLADKLVAKCLRGFDRRARHAMRGRAERTAAW